VLLVVTGTLHFAAASGFESIVPRWLGSPAVWVYLSGVAELACAAAIAYPTTRRPGALTAAGLFVAVFPANIQMALNSHAGSHDLLHDPVIAWGRLPLQLPLVLWALYAAREDRRQPAVHVASSE
jgi:uncharacterized membrane protein